MIMKEYFLKFPVITTERLILRKCELSDTDCFYNLASNPELPVNLTWDYYKNKEETIAFISSMQQSYAVGECKTWAICEKSTNNFMGLITLRMANSQPRGEIGYWIGVQHWNKGYMTEALESIISFCFNILNVNRIQAEHFVCNPASGRVMEKVGMKYEGVLRKYILAKGIFHDCKLYSILKEEYELAK